MADLIEQPLRFQLGAFLLQQLTSDEWTSFRAAVAFVKSSGVRHIERPLAEFGAQRDVAITAGVSLGGTSIEGLERLAKAVRGRVWIFHNESGVTFHPKVYLFENTKKASLVVGSGNLTEGGLFVNYEASLRIDLDLSDAAARRTYTEVDAALNGWRDEKSNLARRLTPEFFEQLVREGYIRPERLTPDVEERPASRQQREEVEAPVGEAEPRRRLFASARVPSPPKVEEEAAPTEGRARGAAREAEPAAAPVRGPSAEPLAPAPAAPVSAERAAAAPPVAAIPNGFLMTLQTTDVGYGQTTAGTQRRSPEIFIPLAARDAAPGFWGWPGAFTPDPAHAGKNDRRVTLRIGGNDVEATLYNWPDKHDFRLRTEVLRAGANVGDILRLERAADGQGFDFYAEVVPRGTTLFGTYLALCVNPVRNSKKVWGYY